MRYRSLSSAPVAQGFQFPFDCLPYEMDVCAVRPFYDSCSPFTGVEDGTIQETPRHVIAPICTYFTLLWGDRHRRSSNAGNPWKLNSMRDGVFVTHFLWPHRELAY